MLRDRPIVQPLYVGSIGGKPVRFFRSPSKSPDLPWHSSENLHRALGLSREVRRHLLRMTQVKWPGVLRTVATADGLTTIGPHFTAQGIIGAAIEIGTVSADIEGEYAKAGGEALKALLGDLPLEATLAFAAEAFRNETAGDPA